MPHNGVDMDTEGNSIRQTCAAHKLAEDQGRRSLSRAEHYYVCGHTRHDMDSHEHGRRRKKRTKSHPQHCPSCHCAPMPIKYQSPRMECSSNMEAMLDSREMFLPEPINQSIRKSQSSPLSPRPCHCNYLSNTYQVPKKGQMGSRRQQKLDHDPMFSNFLRNMTTNDGIEDCCTYLPSTKAGCKMHGHWRDHQPMAGGFENSDVDSESPEKYKSQYAQYIKSQTTKDELRIPRQGGEKAGKVVNEGKKEIGKRKDERSQQFVNTDLEDGRPIFDISECEKLEKLDLRTGNPADHQEKLIKNRPKLAGEFPPMRSSSARTQSLQSTTKNRNSEDLAKDKALIIDAGDCSRNEALQKESKNIFSDKNRSRSTCRRNSLCRPGGESITNREEIKRDTHCEIILKDKNEEATIMKNIYDDGDLDLHATKSHILSLIDRALSNEFGSTSDQQKNIESHRGSTQQEIYIEITRALQGDCCQSLAQDLLNDCGSSAEYIRQLKILRWEHMNHIQEGFRKLCSLQKFLDTCSPRQSLSTLQIHSTGVEQRTEQRQEQQDKKQ